MRSTGLRISAALLCTAAIPAISGCASSNAGTRTAAVSRDGRNQTPRTAMRTSNRPPRNNARLASNHQMPPDARSGECYAQVYLPPEYETVTERVCVREESEKVEIMPAKYEVVEERVLVKEATTKLVEVPAEFDVQERRVQTSPGHVTWVKADEDQCEANTMGPGPEDVFCLVSEPPTTTTIRTARMVKAPTVKEVRVPAEYQTIRRHKLVRPAQARKVTVPAEYREIEKTVLVAPARMEWQRVSCDSDAYRSQTQVRPASDRNP